MSVVERAAKAAGAGGGELRATHRLAILDELRVPYRVQEPPKAPGGWAALAAGAPERALHWRRATGDPTGGWRLADVPLWGSVAPEAAVEAYARSLGPGWRRGEAVRALDGTVHAHLWRSEAGGTVLPFDPDELLLNLRSERYLELLGGGGRAGALARRGYYALRPLLPRPLQIALRRRYAPIQARRAFPRWPLESAGHDLIELVLGWAAAAHGAPLPHLAPWPDGREWALVLTHDVETAVGRDAIERVRAVEVAAGRVSSWNLVPERYEVPDELVAHLVAAGCEVGVHGLRHDGRDLESERTLRRRLPEMRRWAERWGAVGFRSPATHRVWEWMPELGFDYDTSYPDSDPYEPMAGGCCSWLPFFNGHQVELPITLPQDHTLFVILRRDESLWLEKADALRVRGGLVNVIVHPDYMLDDAPLAAYERFLAAYRDDPKVWAALPRDVAAWWRRRAATVLRPDGAGGWAAEGPGAAQARIRFAG